MDCRLTNPEFEVNLGTPTWYLSEAQLPMDPIRSRPKDPVLSIERIRIGNTILGSA